MIEIASESAKKNSSRSPLEPPAEEVRVAIGLTPALKTLCFQLLEKHSALKPLVSKTNLRPYISNPPPASVARVTRTFILMAAASSSVGGASFAAGGSTYEGSSMGRGYSCCSCRRGSSFCSVECTPGTSGRCLCPMVHP